MWIEPFCYFFRFSNNKVPTGFKIGLCEKAVVHPNRRKEGFKQPERSLLKLTNHTGMFDVCNNTVDKYNAMLDKRGYVFWYISEGMEEGDKKYLLFCFLQDTSRLK